MHVQLFAECHVERCMCIPAPAMACTKPTYAITGIVTFLSFPKSCVTKEANRESKSIRSE